MGARNGRRPFDRTWPDPARKSRSWSVGDHLGDRLVCHRIWIDAVMAGLESGPRDAVTRSSNQIVTTRPVNSHGDTSAIGGKHAMSEVPLLEVA